MRIESYSRHSGERRNPFGHWRQFLGIVMDLGFRRDDEKGRGDEKGQGDEKGRNDGITGMGKTDV